MNFHLGEFVFTYLLLFGFIAPVALFGIPYRCWQLLTGQLLKKIDASRSRLAPVAYLGVFFTVINAFGLLYALALIFQIFTTTGTSGIFLVFIVVLMGVAYAMQELFFLPLMLLGRRSAA